MRILVIEDYLPVRTAVVQGLREAGHSVDEAADGETGLHQALAGEPDLIVLDLMLPGVDGLQILRRLREGGHKCHVLILTARDAVEDRIQGLDLGADDYLVKPFAMEELLARVRALLRREYDQKAPLLQLGHVAINTADHSVTVEGEPITLTAKEYALLEYLAFRAGQVVTRGDIWEHIYDEQSTATSNVVDVYIGYLRRKLERPDRPRLIHTRRGEGYLLARP
jgi:DNA-binding response OmpR family regulator